MPEIIITRSSEFLNRMRRVEIWIDGQKRGHIANGETARFEMSAGEHIVAAKIDWAGSPPAKIFVSEHEVKMLQLCGFPGAQYLQIAFPVLLLIWVIPERYLPWLNGWCSLVLALPVFCWFLYYLSIGRKKYLQLKQKA